jgi:hypothetical protein
MLARRTLAAAALCLTSACYETTADVRVNAENHVMGRIDRASLLLLDDAADSYGVESRGYSQVRGNGCLAVSPIAVLFVPWSTEDEELWIPMDHVLAVDSTDMHLGKAKGVMLVRVRYVNEAGREDSVAWAVKDVPRWVSAIRAARGALGS